MKTKIFLSSLTILIILYFFYERREFTVYEPEVSSSSFVKFVKCTSAKFLLSGVDTTTQIAPRFDNLGDLTFTISSDNKEAQAFFDQGIKLTYAFNHAEAHRSFMEASRLDPTSPMPHWGQAYALGPNINDALPDDERKASAWKALNKAMSLSKNGSKLEQALVEALSARYAEDPSADLQSLNNNYMLAMEKVHEQYPNDAHVQILYAASVMNTMPWNYWDNEGNPAPGTLKAKAALEKAMQIDPDNPGAHHYYIHMVELPNPEMAEASADKLVNLMPGAGHLVHMPSHIYIRLGRYEDAVEVNQRAILADEDYLSQCFSQGLYPLGYYPHNIHFLWSASSFLGDSKTAIEAARKTAEKVPISELEELPFLQDFASTPMLAYARFGKWNEILTIPYPGDDFKHLKMIWHYARGIAFLRKDNIKEAEEELLALNEMQLDDTLKDIIANYTNPTSEIAKVANAVLEGEIAMAKGKTEEAIVHLEDAVKFEDQLIYSEPSPWHIPSRQTLGKVLMQAGNYVEAQNVFEADLKKNRQNGWSLFGLYNSLKEQGKTEEAATIKSEFDKAWANADMTITTSVL